MFMGIIISEWVDCLLFCFKRDCQLVAPKMLIAIFMLLFLSTCWASLQLCHVVQFCTKAYIIFSCWFDGLKAIIWLHHVYLEGLQYFLLQPTLDNIYSKMNSSLERRAGSNHSKCCLMEFVPKLCHACVNKMYFFNKCYKPHGCTLAN